MAKTVTILGPYSPKAFHQDAATIASAISTAIGSNECVTADPAVILGNVFVVVTTK